MSQTGRYYIKDEKSGRTFMVEPMHERNEKATDVTFKNGYGSSDTMGGVKGKPSQGGSISPDESIITEENGFKDIVVIGPYMSPDAYVNHIIKNNLRLNDPEEIQKGYARLPE